MSRLRADTLVNYSGSGSPNFKSGVTGAAVTFTGDVTAANGSFTGNVTIDGDLTYKDVTNVDSVGIITAQEGIQVSANGVTVSGVGTFNNPITVAGIATINGGGLDVTGVITATSYSGDGSSLSGVSPSVSGIASGTLANGQTVILHSDGKVGAVATTGIGQTLTSEVIWESASSNEISYLRSTFDSSNNKVVFSYVDGMNSSYGTAVVGTVTGTAVTFGTPVVFSSSATTYTAITFDSSNNKVVIAYSDIGGGNNYVGKAIVGTVSGDSISFGSAVTFASDATALPSMAFDSTNNKVVIAFRDNGNSYYGTAIVGTVSGTSISFGSEVVYESANVSVSSATFDTSSGKILIAYKDIGNSNYGTGIVGTVSGTSISFGSPTVFRSGNSSQIESDYDSANNKHLIVFEDESSSQVGSAVVATVSGTSVSFGSKVTFSHPTSSFGRADLKYEPTSGKFVVAWRDGGDSNNGNLMVGSVVGTSVTFTNKTTYFTGNSSWQGISIDTDQQVSVIGYAPTLSAGSKGRARVFRPSRTDTNLTSSNFLGFSNAAYTDGQTATVQIAGAVDDAQSGLTTASVHYVQNDGTLSTSAGTPSVEAGLALSATEIAIKA